MTPSLKYFVSTGRLYINGLYAGVCYSGHELGLNNSKLEADAGVGPIPVGMWAVGTAYDHPHLGPHVMNLTPVGHDAHGRTLFRMHGDNSAGNESASHGCIVADLTIRLAVIKSGARTLEVCP